jgi:hypothetical protein
MVRRHGWPLGGALLGLLLLTLLTVTARRMTNHTTAADALSVARDDGGLHLSLSVPRGPYFRDELLPVTLVLANNSGRPIPYAVRLPFLGSARPSPR